MRRSRRARRARDVGVIGVVAATVTIAAWFAMPGPRAVERASLVTAYAALLLLAASLATGPLNVLRERTNPLSSDVRRDLGIGAALLACAHTLIGLQVHMRHRWEYFVHASPQGDMAGLRFDAFGLTNQAGLLAALALIVLLAISSDRALARLGRVRWKRLQRANYLIAALVFLHGAIYQLLEHRVLPGVLLLLAASVAVIVLQVLGIRAVRRDRARRFAFSVRRDELVDARQHEVDHGG